MRKLNKRADSVPIATLITPVFQPSNLSEAINDLMHSKRSGRTRLCGLIDLSVSDPNQTYPVFMNKRLKNAIAKIEQKDN